MALTSKNRLRSAIGRRIASRFAAHAVKMANARPLVSITFDDCPKTAVQDGAAILTSFGALGTFYVAGGLADREWENGVQFSAPDVQRLINAGHEVGCHSFSHPDCATLSAAAFRAELDANRAYLAAVTHQLEVATFAYPYGSISYTTKREARRRFLAARGVTTGVNNGDVDMADLKAVAIPQHGEGGDWSKPWLDLVVRTNGWLVLFTHDVTAQPTAFGCTPDTLRATIAAIRAAGVDIVTVGDGARLVAGGVPPVVAVA